MPGTAQETSNDISQPAKRPSDNRVILLSPSRNQSFHIPDPPTPSPPNPAYSCLFAALLGVNGSLLAHGSLDGND